MTSVLIVEDEESLADPLAFLLRKEGFEATVVADGPSALAEFERAGADIVLLDLMLPGMSGTDVCKQRDRQGRRAGTRRRRLRHQAVLGT
jgi:two-component system response regulator RegX3